MPIRIAVIAEAEADRRQICETIDRKILSHAPDWLDAEQLETERIYCGLLPNTIFTKWAELRDIPKVSGAPRSGIIGFNEGQNRRFDYPLGRKALIHCALAHPRIDAAVLVRDMDQQHAERTASLAQARSEVSEAAMRVVLALPRAKREAWVLNGFVPLTKSEKRRYEDIRSKLSFDPCECSEELHAMKEGATRDAKRVLAELIGKDLNREDRFEREARCWRATEWKILRERGKESGLARFLEDVKEHLVPLVTGNARPN